MNATVPTHRANGLDTLRATAITLVFLYHYRVFLSPEPDLGWIGVIGWVGVDLFFVLSGYLIANQIFAGIAQERALSIKAFYARRAFRTLPLYWLVLACYFLFPVFMGGRALPPLWTFLTFTQNIGLRPGTAFSHAWSLCIEEQFYLVLPIVVVAGVRYGGTRLQGWILLFALLSTGIVARIALWRIYGRQSMGQVSGYYPYIYYSTLCRFDEFLPGIAVAMMKNFHRPTWERMTKYGGPIFVASIIIAASVLYLTYRFYSIADYGYGFFMTALGYSLIAVSCALLVVAALAPNSWLYRLRIPGAKQLALWSYAIYLSHKAVAVIAQREFRSFELSSSLMFAVIVLACMLCGWLLYRWVESPFMAMRDRLFPTVFANTPSQIGASAQNIACSR